MEPLLVFELALGVFDVFQSELRDSRYQLELCELQFLSQLLSG